MTLSFVKYAMAASLVPMALALPTNYMPNSARAVKGTLLHCSHRFELPVYNCVVKHGSTIDMAPTSIVDVTVPNNIDVTKISAADIAASANLTFEQMLDLIVPETNDKSIMEHTVMGREFEPTRDANGEIIVGVDDGKFTQTEEQRQKLDKEEQKEKDAEDKIEAIAEAKKHGGDDGKFTVDDAQRKKLDDEEQKEEEELEKKKQDYQAEMEKEEASTTYIQGRKLKEPARDQDGMLIIGDHDGVFTQTERNEIEALIKKIAEYVEKIKNEEASMT